MKRLIMILLGMVAIISLNAQQYVNVTQVCPQCGGYGAVATYLGPICCPTCGGYGQIVLTVPNPYYNPNSNGYNVSFGSNSNSDGYIYKGTINLTRVCSRIQDTFYLFNKGGVNYVAVYKSGPYYRLQHRMCINNIDYIY